MTLAEQREREREADLVRLRASVLKMTSPLRRPILQAQAEDRLR